MYILVFETTGQSASVACIDRYGNTFFKKSNGVLNHLQSLMPMTEELLRDNGIEAADISCVAASAGPGSFTGIRIGVATARAFAQAAGIPCVAVPTLHTFLYNIENNGEIFCPVLDARRGQIYGGAFSLDREPCVHEHVSGGAYDLFVYLDLLGKSIERSGARNVVFFGDGLFVYGPEIKKWADSQGHAKTRIRFAEEEDRLQRADSAARVALKLYNEGKTVSYKDFTPLYMRKAEAERKLPAPVIRPAEKGDVREMSCLEEMIFTQPWSEKSLMAEITDNNTARYIVAEADGAIVGYAGVWLILDEGHITNIAVHPAHRRRGIARKLILSLIEKSGEEGAAKFTLEVRASNNEAIALYKSMGFAVAGIRKEYYEDNGEDAVIMWKA